MIKEQINNKYFLSNMTPQMRKDKKSQQIKRISNRISLLKKQLNKHKQETSIQKYKLNQIFQQAKQFEKKVFDQILKCNQLKKNSYIQDKNKNCSDTIKQNKKQNLTQNKNTYNLNKINQKNNLNSQITLNQGFLTTQQTQYIQKANSVHIFSKKQNQKSNKKIHLNTQKNSTISQKYKNFYLKETFVTSIILVSIGIFFKHLILVF